MEEELPDKVKSKEEFILFSKQLSKDLVENRQDWENQDLDPYLESMIAWIEDTNESNLEGNVWAVMSSVIVAPKYYE